MLSVSMLTIESYLQPIALSLASENRVELNSLKTRGTLFGLSSRGRCCKDIQYSRVRVNSDQNMG
jgi:hypothetical protein